MKKSWIFDFDGTLVDSAPSIKKCYEKITLHIAPERIEVAKKITIGPTLIETAKEILGEQYNKHKDQFIQLFQSQYDNELIFQTKTYTNASNILQKLNNNGDHIAIATNKRYEPTVKLLNYFNWSNYFKWVACIDQHPQFKNKSEMIKFFISKHQEFRNSYLVGDTLSDGVAANENNLNFIKVNFGYGNRQNWEEINIYKTISTLDELVY